MWVDYVTAGGVVAASLAAVMAYRQLNESKKAARGQLMFAIDQALAPFEDVRRAINRGVEVDEIELRRYLAAFERIGVLLDEGYVAPAVLDRLYGSRFENLVTKRDGSYVDLVRKSPGAWPDFLVTWNKLSTFRKIPSPPSP